MEAAGVRLGGILLFLNPSRLPVCPQGSPVIQEPDILRLKANVSGAQAVLRRPPGPHWGRASHRGEDPPPTNQSCPSLRRNFWWREGR